MIPLNDGRRFLTDPVDALRTGALVESDDVGLSQEMYLGQFTYVFLPDDVGRLIEVIQDMSPGFVSWGFSTVFADLRAQYPETKPYITEG